MGDESVAIVSLDGKAGGLFVSATSSGTSLAGLRLDPHSLQNLFPAGLFVPHSEQVRSNRCPHSPQNFASGGLPEWQFGHSIIAPPLLMVVLSELRRRKKVILKVTYIICYIVSISLALIFCGLHLGTDLVDYVGADDMNFIFGLMMKWI